MGRKVYKKSEKLGLISVDILPLVSITDNHLFQSQIIMSLFQHKLDDTYLFDSHSRNQHGEMVMN